jgi:hypothetical protein
MSRFIYSIIRKALDVDKLFIKLKPRSGTMSLRDDSG